MDKAPPCVSQRQKSEIEESKLGWSERGCLGRTNHPCNRVSRRQPDLATLLSHAAALWDCTFNNDRDDFRLEATVTQLVSSWSPDGALWANLVLGAPRTVLS